MTRSARVDAALPTGRFSIARIDGWLGETWLDDNRTDDAFIEVLSDGTGSFDLGEIQGAFKMTRGRRATWIGGIFDEVFEGTIEFSAAPPQGLVTARIKARGEDPWDVEAWSPGARAEPAR